MRKWLCIFIAAVSITASAFGVGKRPKLVVEPLPLGTTNPIEWLRQHGCHVEELTDGGTRVEIPDLISPADTVHTLRNLQNLREIHFFSGEAKQTDGPYIRTWEWRQEDAEKAISVFRDAFSDVGFSFSAGAF